MLLDDEPPSARDDLLDAVRLEPEDDGIVALCLCGDVDLIVSPLLLDQATYALGARSHIVVDLSDATFIDSSAIHALLRIGAAAGQEGCVTVLQLGTSATVERAIEIAGVERVLPRAETRTEAIATIRRLATAEAE